MRDDNRDGIAPIALPSKKPLAEDAVDHLRELIMRGEFSHGDRLREEHLAAALDVSRGPIRQALAQLEREGLVHRRPNRGSTIARLSRRDLEEVYSMRLALEQVAMQWAAELASQEDLARLDESAERIAAAVKKTVSVQEAARLDIDFHNLLYDAAHHSRLQRAWAELRTQVYLFLLARGYVGTPAFAPLMIDQHRTLIEVLRSRDIVRAREAAELHVRRSYLRVIESYAEDDPDGTHPVSRPTPNLVRLTGDPDDGAVSASPEIDA